MRYAKENVTTVYSPAVTNPSRSLPSLHSTINAARPNQQYWAQRALTAETLLIARSEYEREVRQVASLEEQRRLVCCSVPAV
jgi:negative regulator of sigma E activity